MVAMGKDHERCFHWTVDLEIAKLSNNSILTDPMIVIGKMNYVRLHTMLVTVCN